MGGPGVPTSPASRPRRRPPATGRGRPRRGRADARPGRHGGQPGSALPHATGEVSPLGSAIRAAYAVARGLAGSPRRQSRGLGMPRIMLSVAGALALASLVANPLTASAGSFLQQLTTDPFHNTSSQHQTEVEPDIASSGSTL